MDEQSKKTIWVIDKKIDNIEEKETRMKNWANTQVLKETNIRN